MATPRRLPISARHAFALAFDLAVRRDALHSLVVPLVLRAPWILAPAVVPALWPTIRQEQTVLVRAGSVLLDFLTFVVLTAMLRFRARSAFNTSAGTAPAPIRECYARGLRRAPALYLTEAMRNVALAVALPLVFPFLWIAFKLAFATETVVLREMNPFRAIGRSFRLTEGRFERWLELIVITVLLVVPLWFLMTLGYFTAPGSRVDLWYTIGQLLTAAIIPVIQYAWTFFYLRLEEIDSIAIEPTAPPAAAAPAHAWRASAVRQPQLRLVDLRRESETEGEDVAE